MRSLRLAALLVLTLAAPALAGTFTCVKKLDQLVGIINLVLSACTLSNSYATGGDVPTDVGNVVCGSFARKKPLAVFVEGSKGGVLFSYDQVNNKLQAFRSAGFTPAGTVAAPTLTAAAGPAANALSAGASGSAIANATAGALTGLTGIQAPAFTGTAVAAASMVEVTAATDLSAITIGMIALCP